MARMRLHKNTRFGDNEVYPIYDIDFANLSSTGYVQQESNDAVGSHAYKYRQWKTINNNIGLYIPRNIPKLETQEGNIIPFWHRYNNLVDGRYTMPTENLESFAAVEQGIRPDDWGTNPNYVEFVRENISSPVNRAILRPYTNRTISTWSSSISYYEDTKRTELRMFFTDTGCSFTVTKMSYPRGDGYYIWPRTYSVGIYPHYISSIRFPANYAYTDPEGRVIDDDYYINDTISVINPNTGYGDWSNYTDGYNCQMVFVHYVQNGTDFYGVAIIQMNNFTEQSEPVAIHVSAWDASFWGTSIIAGGGGGGPWTNDGPTSYVQGGQGGFDAPSNNHGDSNGQSAKTIASNWSANHSPFDQGYNKYILSSPDATAFKQMVDNLVDPDVWQGFDNKYYNPIDSIITCSMIPASLAPSGSDIGASSVIKASKLNLTEATVPTFNIWNKAIHIGSVDIRSYCDGFPDYDNTAIYINLPYVGVKQLDTNACMEGELAVDYLVDYMTQDVTAQIWVKDRFGNYNIRYEFKGNCGKQIPLNQIIPRSTQFMSAAQSAIAPALFGIAGGAVVGGIAGLAGYTAGGTIASGSLPAKVLGAGIAGKIPMSLAKTLTGGMVGATQGVKNAYGMASQGLTAAIGASASVALGASQQMTSSNANGGAVSSPVNTQCYILITRPMWSAPEEYGKQFGYPSDIGGTINQSNTEAGDPFTNFLSVRSILLDGMSCTIEERNEIENLMKAGVYVSNDE